MKLTEDDLYRNSSQYKHWSFTPAQLAALRSKTNAQATDRVKANVARQRAQRAKNLDTTTATASASDGSRANTPSAENGNGGTGANTPVHNANKEVDCLTVAEEMRLVDKFCETTLELGTFIETTPEVTATCIQFLRRFYLYNSLMTYDASPISQTAMFLALKTENMTRPSRSNADEYAAKFPNKTKDQILAPEYLVVQALRFNFDVRHPFRGLKGAHLELADMLRGAYVPLAHDSRSGAEIRSEMLRLPRRAGEGIAGQETSEEDMSTRLNNAYAYASHLLKTAAQLTDAYFHYTPSQIMLAAHLLADEPLTSFYLSTKIPAASPQAAKLLATLRACAALLSSHSTFTSSTSTATSTSNIPAEEKEAKDKREKKEIRALMNKLKACRDPEKVDLVKLNQAQKRDAVKDGELEESKAKRRKLGREKAEAEADAFWGPELPKPKP